MNMTKSVQMKLTLIVFTLLIALAFAGAVSASLGPTDEIPAVDPDPYVVESGEAFMGPTAIQDSIDSVNTMNGYHIQIVPETFVEQVTINKDLTITGMGASPEDTAIVSCSDGGTVNVPSGVAVILENIAIWNVGNGQAIINNGQLTLINCMVNGEYVTGTLPVEQTMSAFSADPIVNEIVTGTVTTHTDLGAIITLETQVAVATEQSSKTETTNTEPAVNSEDNSNPTTDPVIPLASLASGMLMVMGGTVISKKHY